MTNLAFSALIAGGSLCAGFLGSLTGLGGGVVIVPLLTLAFGVDIHYAVGASLVSVIATSSGAAAAYVREGFSNIRVGMLLEIATSVGAITGAFIAPFVPTSVLAVIFGLVLMHSAYLSFRKKAEHAGPDAKTPPGPLARKFKLDSSYPGADGPVPYSVHHVPTGFGVMTIAGLLSGLLGIGSGALKVIAMDHAMGLPFKVSTTTSNFMIGVTAAASAGVYLARGYVDPAIAMPVMLGVLTGAFTGARVLAGARVRVLRIAFAVVVFALAVQMIISGARGTI